MSDYKITGCCTCCDDEVFEVLSRFGEDGLRPGEPERLGHPHGDAMRSEFLLNDGTTSYLTFCGACAVTQAPEQYPEIWAKVLRSWEREIGDNTEKHVNWLPKQYENGIASEIRRLNWTEVLNG